MLAGVLVTILIPVGFIFGGIFVRPVKKLKDAADRISKGDLDYNIDVKSNDELEEFAGSFREMVANIKGKQSELLQEKTYTENIISSMTDALVVLNLDKTIKGVNEAGLDLLGYKKQELLGRPAGMLFAEEPFREKAFDRLTDNGSLRSFDTVCKTKAGERIPVSFSASAMRSKEGRVMAILCVARDMRQRKALISDLEKSKAELEELSKGLEQKVVNRTKDLAQTQEATLNIMEDVQESKEDLEKANLQLKKAKSEIESFSRGIEAMVESMAEGVIMIDRQGNPVVLNPQAKMMMGFGLNEPVTSHALNGKMRLIGLTQAVEECRDKGRLVVKELIIPHEKSVILHCDISPVKGAQGRLLGIVAILRDVTREKEIDSMKTEFISTVSHELRTPLSITKEGVSLVMDEIPGKINQKQGKILTTARDNIDRLARIINSLLDISKIEAGKVELKRGLINIVDLAKQAADNFTPKIKAKQLTLKTNFLKKKIPVYADSDKIMQVFINLLSNALKFTEKGSIEVSVREKDDRIECAVSDTGIGISRQDLPKVFGKFQQFGRVAGGGEKGTGLGLSIAKGIVGLHHGIIRVESKQGRGAKFIFSLPKYTAEVLLKEYVNNGIKGAIKTDSKMSLVRVSMAEPAKLKRSFADSEIDAMLTEMEDVLKAGLRREGDSALKVSSEIVVVLSNCSKENSLRVKSRFEELLKDSLAKKKLSGKVKLKFGCVTYPDEGKTAQELIEKK
jgi:PAS domain S-box-containing protein